MSKTANLKPGFRFTGKHMMASMICFFGVIILVNFFMATLASKSWTGLIVKNSYVASQEYNDELKKAADQKSRGWKSRVSYAAGSLVLTLRNENNNILTFDKVVAEIGRPVFEQEDQTLQFMPLASGGNEIAIHLEPGIWALKIKGDVAGITYRRDLRIDVDSSGTGKTL
jgi:nitrogen fixation protein FixH